MNANANSHPRVVRDGVAVTLLLGVLSWALPHLASSAPVRDHVVNAPLKRAGLEARAEAASFGWFAPTSVKGLRVTSADEQIDIRAEELRIDQPWWQLVLFSDPRGHLELSNPRVTLVLDPTDTNGATWGEIPALTASLKDAEFNLRLVGTERSLIALSAINVDLRVQSGPNACLEVGNGRVLENCPLTPEMCDSLLQWIDPALSGVVRMEGRFSLDLLRLRVPLNVPAEEQLRRLDCEAILHLHEVTVRVTTPLLRRMVDVWADMYGQDASAGPCVQDNRIRLLVHEGHVFHDQIALGFPGMSREIRIESSGSVGLNKSLDLRISLPQAVVAPEASHTDPAAIVRYHVSGTIDDPEVNRVPADAVGQEDEGS